MPNSAFIFIGLLTALMCAPAPTAASREPTANNKEGKMEREPAVAGQFYPNDKELLIAKIDSMIARASPPKIKGKIIGIQVPHAGIEFSGPTAAFAYKTIAGKEGITVVMLGPSHQAEFNRAAVFTRGAWKTPLGKVVIGEDFAQRLLKEEPYFADLPEVHQGEHSLEVQLPFLQRVLKDFKIVPIMLFFPTYEECERVGRAVAKSAKEKNVLLLASSDLYHGYSYTEARASDSLTLTLMEKLQPKEFYQALTKSYATRSPLACGGYPIVALMVAAKELGADTAVVLYNTNSNDVLHQRGGYCVGYSAVAFLKRETEEKGQQADQKTSDAVLLTLEEQQSLLKIARQTIEQYISKGKIPEFSPLTERLKEKRGVFVTLHKKGELRGCIGYVEPIKPLYLATRDMAISAATEDPRFPPVRIEELPAIDIEITVLSPLARITDPKMIEVGKHGLVIRKGFHSGLLLPQVPVEQGWNREEFLTGVCWKAGLPPDAWKEPDAELYVFTGQVFGEKKK